jgi:hypothetical protein
MFGPAQVRMKKTDQGFRFLVTIVVVSLISMPYEKADNVKNITFPKLFCRKLEKKFIFAGLVSRSILIDLGLFYRLFQKDGLYLVFILLKSLLFYFNSLFISELLVKYIHTASHEEGNC